MLFGGRSACSFIVLFVFFSTTVLTAYGEIIQLLEDQQEADGLPKNWRPLTFSKIFRHTEYKLIQEGNRPVITATSRQSASGLYRSLDLHPKEYPILSWCWKVNRVITQGVTTPAGDETKKSGDDYAARIYVTFKFEPNNATFWERTKFGTIKTIYGEYPPKGALNYVWAGHLPIGTSFSNPYTDRAKMVVVESGNEKAMQWVCEEHNLYEDYKRLFGEEPPVFSGVAVMTDTDNTGGEATAYYADLVLQQTRRQNMEPVSGRFSK